MADAVGELIGREHAIGEVRIAQRIDEFVGGGPRQVRASGMGLAIISDAPDAAAGAVASRMFERHFVMADDAIVEISDIERAVGTELNVHGAEPGIIAGEEVRHFVGDFGRALLGEAVAVEAAGHHVPDENVVAVFLRPK